MRLINVMVSSAVLGILGSSCSSGTFSQTAAEIATSSTTKSSALACTSGEVSLHAGQKAQLTFSGPTTQVTYSLTGTTTEAAPSASALTSDELALCHTTSTPGTDISKTPNTSTPGTDTSKTPNGFTNGSDTAQTINNIWGTIETVQTTNNVKGGTDSAQTTNTIWGTNTSETPYTVKGGTGTTQTTDGIWGTDTTSTTDGVKGSTSKVTYTSPGSVSKAATVTITAKAIDPTIPTGTCTIHLLAQ